MTIPKAGSSDGQMMTAAAREVNPALQLIHLNTFTFGNMIKFFSRLPDNDKSAVLINTYSRDVQGTTMEMERFVKLSSESSQVPTYILYTFDSNHGAVGGSLIDGWHQGEAAAKMAVRILRKGEKASDIPPSSGTKPQIIVDYQQLVNIIFLGSSAT